MILWKCGINSHPAKQVDKLQHDLSYVWQLQDDAEVLNEHKNVAKES